MISSFSRAIRLSRRALCLLAPPASSCLLAAGADSADAQAYRSYRTHKTQRAAARPARRQEGQGEAAPPQPVHLIVVSIPKQRISLYGAGGFHKQGAVSTGTAGFPTPTGVFSVIQKNRYHRSNIYSGAPMPFMQRITWSGVAMHAGVLPGYPASHGCIRLTHQFASELWGMTRMGVRVIVTPDDAQPAEIAHAKLPTPTMTPAPAAVTDAERDQAVAGGDGRRQDGRGERGAERAVKLLESARARQGREGADGRRGSGQGQGRQGSGRGSRPRRPRRPTRRSAALREAEQALAAARDQAGCRHQGRRAGQDARGDRARPRRRRAPPRPRSRRPPRPWPRQPRVEAAKTQEAFAAAQAAWDAEKASDLAAADARGRASAPPSRSRCSSARRPAASTSARPGGPSTTRRPPSGMPRPRSARTSTWPPRWWRTARPCAGSP